MNLEKITQEFKKQLPEDVRAYSNTKKWKLYINFSGFYKDLYFDIYFMEHKNGLKKIEISPTTEKPLEFVNMIKNIDKKAVITYHKIQSTEVSVLS